MVKFSTMLLNSPNIDMGEITLKKDLRISPFSRILRITKINEIPQVINILKGDMTIVGPRPLTPKHFKFYAPEQQEIIKKMKPGLTGIGSIIFREEEEIIAKSKLGHEETYKQKLCPYKAALENWCMQNQSPVMDLKLIFLTVWAILLKESELPYRIFQNLPMPPQELSNSLSKNR